MDNPTQVVDLKMTEAAGQPRVEPGHPEQRSPGSGVSREQKTEPAVTGQRNQLNLSNQLAGYSLVALLIILSVPTLQNIFYEQSKVWLRQVEPYKTAQMTGLMQLLSVMGDGEFFFYMIIAVCYGRGKTYDYCYLSTCFILNYHWGNMLKQALHHSRPQFDDPTLAHENYGDCASEFGNPSGHMLATTQFFITLNLFYKDKIPTLFKENKWLPILLKGSCFIIVFLMGFSRWYLGRHSIDQVIIGAMLGALSAHFFFYCMKPHMFDPVFHPDFP